MLDFVVEILGMADRRDVSSVNIHAVLWLVLRLPIKLDRRWICLERALFAKIYSARGWGAPTQFLSSFAKQFVLLTGFLLGLLGSCLLERDLFATRA